MTDKNLQGQFDGDTYYLIRPFNFGDRDITKVTFKEPTAKEMAFIKEGMNLGDTLKIGGMLCDLTPRLVDCLKKPDVWRIAKHTNFLLADV